MLFRNTADENMDLIVTAEIWGHIMMKSLKNMFLTQIMRNSTWNILMYLIGFIMVVGFTKEPIEMFIVLMRFELFLIPVFWTLTGEKVMLYLNTFLKKLFKIYQFS